MSTLQWHSTAEGSLPVDEDVIFIRHGFKCIETGYVTEEGIIPADIADDAADPCIPLECVEWFAPLKDALPDTADEKNAFKAVLDDVFPKTEEDRLLVGIIRAVEESEEFRNLVEMRREHPDLTLPRKRISLWIKGIDRHPGLFPKSVDAALEDIEESHNEYIVPVSEEYAAFAGRMDGDELDALFTISIDPELESDVDLGRNRRLAVLIREFEKASRSALLECRRRLGDRN